MVFPVLLRGGCAVIHPFSNAFSTIFFSIFSMETGSSFIPRTQASSHGAGHSLPVNSGKLFVACKILLAFSHLPRYTASLKSGIRFPNGQPLWQNGIPQSMHLAPCS